MTQNNTDFKTLKTVFLALFRVNPSIREIRVQVSR